MLHLTGCLEFAPDRGADFRKVNKLKTLVLNLELADDIAAYYRKQVIVEYGPWCKLHPPMFGLHVTVIRGYGDSFDPTGLEKLTGQKLIISLKPCGLARTPWAKRQPGFWFLPVISKDIMKLRRRARVKAFLPFQAHLTIGRESPSFMHAKPPAYPLAVALRCLELIPSPKAVRETGNAQLINELQAFVNSCLVNPLFTGQELMMLIAKHVTPPPKKAWEAEILKLFVTEELTG